ncbi:MAG: hypothetical protein Q7S09_02040 [bacterium]|nr:hypothetical protein [bacterium]
MQLKKIREILSKYPWLEAPLKTQVDIVKFHEGISFEDMVERKIHHIIFRDSFFLFETMECGRTFLASQSDLNLYIDTTAYLWYHSTQNETDEKFLQPFVFRQTIHEGKILPPGTRSDLKACLDAILLERAVYTKYGLCFLAYDVYLYTDVSAPHAR